MATQDDNSPFLDPSLYKTTDPSVKVPGPVVPGTPANGVGGGTQPMPAWTTDPSYAGMDPALQKIYLDSGYTPAGRGTGFADWQYWNDKPSQFGRLTSDIAGTGTDQTTGTPWGSGAWQNSGVGANAGAPASGGVGAGAPNLGAFDVQSYLARFAPSAGAATPQGTALFNQFEDIAKQGTNVSPTDPVIAAQTDAYRAEADRGAKDAISFAAEKGGSLGNTDAVARSAFENAGQSTANFQAQAMTNELAARRTQIMQALSGASGLLTSEQQMQLQEELASMDAALNESQFGRNLAEQAYQFDTNTNNAVFGG